MTYLRHLLLIPMLAVLFTSCLEEVCEENRIVRGFEPVVVNAEEWRSSTFPITAPQPVCEASGFYVYDQYLLMVEETKGLHIYDNSDPANPRAITFMEAPGVQGMAVRNGILYLNQFTDLVAFDLTDPAQPEAVGRTPDAFEPHTVFARQLDNGEFVVEWVETAEQRVVNCNDPQFSSRFWSENGVFFADDRGSLDFNAFSQSTAGNPETVSGGENVGQGGSLARFTIANGTLYVVDESRLKTFDLTDPEQPVFVGNAELGRGIETLFPYGNQLYVGSRTGMHIYDVSEPLAPQHLSTFEHVLSCDPVVVANDLAYVTLWGGRDCGATDDQLEIIDVSDPRNPVSLQITPMSSSHGLGVAEGKLFLCAQWEGLRVFDLDDNGLLGQPLDHVEGIIARDVIVQPQTNHLIVLGYYEDGVSQYEYADDGRLSAVSRLNLCQ